MIQQIQRELHIANVTIIDMLLKIEKLLERIVCDMVACGRTLLKLSISPFQKIYKKNFRIKVCFFYMVRV